MRPWKLVQLLAVVAGLAAAGCAAVQPDLWCENDDQCFNDDAGTRYICDVEDTYVCLRACEDDGDCLKLQVCDVPSGKSEGVCRDDTGSN